MPEPEPRPADPPITRILRRLADGDQGAADDLLPLVYEELQELARARMRELGPGQTMQATALVHEAWMRLGGREAVAWDDRRHFYGAAARAMRLILVDQFRRRSRVKRGGGDGAAEPLETIEVAVPAEEPDFDLEALDLALTAFEEQHPRHARMVGLRYFGGLEMAAIAELLDVSLRTVERDWTFARTWLHREIERHALRGD